MITFIETMLIIAYIWLIACYILLDKRIKRLEEQIKRLDSLTQSAHSRISTININRD